MAPLYRHATADIGIDRHRYRRRHFTHPGGQPAPADLDESDLRDSTVPHGKVKAQPPYPVAGSTHPPSENRGIDANVGRLTDLPWHVRPERYGAPDIGCRSVVPAPVAGRVYRTSKRRTGQPIG